ncbi:shikimate dehydrogenase [Collibacillus ludicampi]|uniref:Shikimate dehydrogenase (NADP(+)) n=1 Tax=Collibacillus ludicampi TaxID=2771369 RepID=A0AAV4LKM7_9BACL|nr:shikimate dehydrogenase [Collibacillus ludicampi]GIM48362.1 shikimate dehydrogenase [Collibacillus ludicampi]
MITSTTRLTGLFGHPVIHSKSPQMHNAAFHHMGLDFAYLAFDVSPERLADAVQGIRAMGLRGVNVTIPHKVEVMRFLDRISPEAKLIGAVNTIVNENGVLTGYNTDGIGYLRSLREEVGLKLEDTTVLILGAGGAARAISAQMALVPVKKLLIANRTWEHAKKIAEHLRHLMEVRAIHLDEVPDVVPEIDLLVNTTSLGMYPNLDQVPIHTKGIRQGMVVSDLIYNPRETRLLKEAKQKGAIIHNGIGMFVYQGAEAFTLWTGLPAPVDVMRQTVESCF